MSEVHYFPRYSQKENMVTNNTLLLFRRLYNHSPIKFTEFMNALFENNDIVLNTTVKFKQQEKASSGSVPDGYIEQESIKVVIETKLYGQKNLPQIKKHWDGFENEDQQIFLWINKEPISGDYLDKINKVLNTYNDDNQQNIQFVATTFKDICNSFNNVLNDYDLEMKGLIDDYESFCNETNLIDNSDSKIRVVLTGKTLEQNLKYNVYYNPADRGYQNTKYLGLYKEKAVRAIGEFSCIVDAQYIPKADKIDIIKEVKGSVTEEQKEIIKEVTIEAKHKYGYQLEEGRRFFFVDKYYETNYMKKSKGAVQGTRYIDLPEIDGIDQDMSAADIAELLNGKTWEI
ncbi:hypothetical protein [Aquisalibacillus elongatus]|uniref:PD-(D/E)XK nuclease superfamily protein n=1 Tax=Aquisalibacillus elongatus TaxID=485577 RepID=A0A3N5CC06_9BACI|nr:hypothetical protein [Aquisalibacillus elongatus]RPF54431.1 hypothetical protein EDC24_1630 [Aquisalibacillus elongatus]